MLNLPHPTIQRVQHQGSRRCLAAGSYNPAEPLGEFDGVFVSRLRTSYFAAIAVIDVAAFLISAATGAGRDT
jgi:hypothetical protein